MNNLIVTLSPKEHKRIFAKISIDPKTKCWNWIGSLDQQGYGLLWYKHRTERIHRILYAFFVRPIPRGTENRRLYQIDHKCRNHRCCNPEHLELTTQKINGLRGNGVQAVNARKQFCKHGHPLPKYEGKSRCCKVCDSIRHQKRLRGPQRKYWLQKAKDAAQRYRDKNKI